MRLLHLSDTHSEHHNLHNLPVADIIIHSGDITLAGTGEGVMDFIEWFSGLNYKYKIFIAGNHDFCLDGKNAAKIQRFLPENTYYLCDSGVEIEGIRFWGIPLLMSYELDSEKYQRSLSAIPANTDVLITHRPPFGILDKSGYNLNMGCPDLLQAVRKIRPRYHLFGHIHEVYGTTQSDGTTFCNGSILNENYLFVNEPIVFEI